MSYDFDVIVIGSGAGGGTFAFGCAQAGKRVLLLERGRRYPPIHHPSEAEMLIEKRPYEDRAVRVNGAVQRLYLGGVYGGGTALYGAALVRPSKEDFHPGRSYGSRIPKSAWDWPISYQDLEPFYCQAENLYGVTGCIEDNYAPLQRPARGYARQARPVSRVNRKLMAANQAKGLKPFRLPLAIDFEKCLRCSVCPGYICPTGARRSSAQLVDESVRRGLPLHIMTDIEVESLIRNSTGRVDGIRVQHRSTGVRAVYRSRRYGLAAGALGSAALLLRSGFGGPLLGRNYMYHLGPIVAGIFPSATGADSSFVKEVGFADYYLGTKRYPHKMGMIQSLPVPGPLMLAKAAGPGVPSAVLRFFRKRMLPLLGIIEDLPNPNNRVTIDSDGQPAVSHSFAAYDFERCRQLCGFMRRILKTAGAMFCSTKISLSGEHVAHQCGTLRFGRSENEAVADPDCRLFRQPDVFVVDGSIFPTSLGIGPALTIMANALRVAHIVTQEI